MGVGAEPVVAEAKNQTLRLWIAECFANNYGKKAVRPRTVQKYHENILLYVPARILDTPLRNVTTPMLRAMFRELQTEVSFATASYTYRLLRDRLNDGVAHISRKLRELIVEAEGCLKSNFLTGASACVRKLVYELAVAHHAEGEHYEDRIKSLKTLLPRVDPPTSIRF